MKISDLINAGAASVLIATLLKACSPGIVGESWTISQRKDEMTDVSYGLGEIKLSGSNNDLDLQVACGKAGRLIYEFKTFDKEGQGISIDKGQNISTKVLLLRADDGMPYNVFDDTSPIRTR